MKIKVNESRCPKNHRCPAINVCPVGAIYQNGFDAPIIDEDKCISCGKCVQMCPYSAFHGSK